MISERYRTIGDRIDGSARKAGRTPSDITLVAVSKKQPDTRVDAVLEVGHRVFGENRVQEAQERWQSRREKYSDLELRLVGPLQSNKASDAVAFFDVIESVDREKLVRVLAKSMEEQDRRIRLYIQVNTGQEAQKSGLVPDDLEAFLKTVRESYQLDVEGLMCLPPVDEPASLHFALLAKLARDNGVEKLSMGMSADFETAIAPGATSVRVGSALFGEREART